MTLLPVPRLADDDAQAALLAMDEQRVENTCC